MQCVAVSIRAAATVERDSLTYRCTQNQIAQAVVFGIFWFFNDGNGTGIGNASLNLGFNSVRDSFAVFDNQLGQVHALFICRKGGLCRS
ncbi:hypothetical protein CBF45_17425 [Bordetella sp. J329]|nr:hypothetical protein CBF45_17425 [Bordetella sp. J329]